MNELQGLDRVVMAATQIPLKAVWGGKLDGLLSFLFKLLVVVRSWSETLKKL